MRFVRVGHRVLDLDWVELIEEGGVGRRSRKPIGSVWVRTVSGLDLEFLGEQAEYLRAIARRLVDEAIRPESLP